MWTQRTLVLTMFPGQLAGPESTAVRHPGTLKTHASGHTLTRARAGNYCTNLNTIL